MPFDNDAESVVICHLYTRKWFVSDAEAGFMRNPYIAYRMNKTHPNTVFLGHDVPDRKINT
ncbi:MAG: hypothetical protein K2G87_02725 [Oscillospiraceae bacterium]|nr:hypothetical protein [Oscillospiraceae bacterium]